MAICISIVVGKGGAGKTTTCVNLATAMALDGNKVLVVDTDTQANTTMFLTSYKLNEKAFQGKGLFDLIRAWGLIDVENYIHKTQIEGIDVIVSNDATPLIPQQLETLEKVSGIKELLVLSSPRSVLNVALPLTGIAISKPSISLIRGERMSERFLTRTSQL